MRVIAILVALYRANPLRPHCDRRNAVHAWTCRSVVGPVLAPDWCKDLPGPIPD